MQDSLITVWPLRDDLAHRILLEGVISVMPGGKYTTLVIAGLPLAEETAPITRQPGNNSDRAGIGVVTDGPLMRFVFG